MATLQEDIVFTLPGVIWRIVPGDNDRWVLEWRDVAAKTVGFCSINPFESERVDTVPGVVDWWSSLAAVSEETFFVHSYRQPDIPEATDVMAFDLENGQLRWTLPGGRLAGFSDLKQPVIEKKTAGESTFFLCEETSGRLLSSHSDHTTKWSTNWVEAIRYREGDSYYRILKDFIYESVQMQPVGTIEYLDDASRMVFSFYLYENKLLAQYVVIVDRFRKVEYCCKVEEGLRKEGDTSLLMKNGWVFFVKERTSFVGIKLSI